MDWPKIIAYVVVGSITGWLFGRHAYRCTINPHHPDHGGDRVGALMLGVVGGLFWQVTIVWAIFKAVTQDPQR